MKHWGYTAREATAWLRICRPGSVVGPQQQFVQDAQVCAVWGTALHVEAGRSSARLPLPCHFASCAACVAFVLVLRRPACGVRAMPCVSAPLPPPLPLPP